MCEEYFEITKTLDDEVLRKMIEATTPEEAHVMMYGDLKGDGFAGLKSMFPDKDEVNDTPGLGDQINP